MRRDYLDPKYRPALIVGGIAAVVTMVASICICCGISTWFFPASSRDNAEKVQDYEITEEEVRKLSEAYDRGHDQAMVSDIFRAGKELPTLDPSQFQFDEVGVIEHPLMVVQVIDDKNGLVRIGGPRSRVMVWMTVPSTERWVDDEYVKLEGAFIVAGKRQYVTVTGAGKTVYLLRWISPATLEKARATIPAT